MRKRLSRRLSKLTAWVFALQMVAAGSCLIMPQAHAGAMHAHAAPMAMDAHCDMPVAAPAHAPASHHGQSCPHCDQPDSIAPVHTGIDLSASALVVAIVPPMAADVATPDPLRAAPVNTGPPRSASLIYHTTQRIRI